MDESRPDHALPEAQFAHYRIDSLLGRGGMGEVYRATDTLLERPVAIKIMRSESVGADDIATRRFLREARAASALNHPNIVTVHQIDTTDSGDHYIVQELIEGQTLRDLQAEPLPVDRVCEIGRQVALALAAAHDAGIVHRDIKPENVMLREDGYVKLLDFGLARLSSWAETDNMNTSTVDVERDTLTGTVPYMSPEQVSDDRVGSPSDVWALGAMMYEMLAGEPPFRGSRPINMVASILTAHPEPLQQARPEVPRPLSDVLAAMLEKDADRRPTARDVEGLLAEIIAVPGAAPAVDVAPAQRDTVGREEERAHLRELYQRASGGQSSVVAMLGEPGIGKTSLLGDFLTELRNSADRPTIAVGRCSESLAGSEAFLPILEALDDLRNPATGPSFDSVIRSAAPTWYTQLTAGSGEADPGAAEDSAPASQERMKRELRALLEQVSRLKPLVLVIDDLHWADLSTVDMLNFLASRFDDMRVLILTCYRPSDMALVDHPFLGIRSDLKSRGVLEELNLDFLSEEDVATYLELQFPNHSLPAAVARFIHTRTDGSPLFMADLVRYLRDSRGIVEEGDTWVLAEGAADRAGELPESVQGMVTRKIEQIDDEQRALLAAASVQGHEFDSASLAEALEMDAVRVEDQLEELERVHVFVRQVDEYEFPDRTLTVRYRFVHVLYQNVLFESLRPTRRVQMAGRIASYLEARQGDDPSGAARLAILYEVARDFGKSSYYFMIASRRAASLFGFNEALTLADRGLEGLEAIPDGPERKQLELGLQLARGHGLRSVVGWSAEEIEKTYGRAQELCHELNDPPELFPVQWNLTFFSMIAGALQWVADQLPRLRAQAEETGETAFVVAWHHVAGVTSEFRGDVEEAHRLLERGRELHPPDEHERYSAMFGIDPGMIARCMSSRPMWTLGHVDRALERARETVALGRSQNQPTTLVFALVVQQGIHLYRGEAEEALALGEEILAICAEYGLAHEGHWSKSFSGGALMISGRPEEGAQLLQEALDELKRLRSGLVRPTFLALVGEAHARCGRVEAGLAAVEEGFEHAESTTERGFTAELHRAKGLLLDLAGDREGAEASFRAALARAREQRARSFEIRAATDLGHHLVEDGRPDEARSELEPVCDWFSEGLDTRDLRRARELLDQIR
jgi:tRNA A-37 threonylcarbamoyl transferase component Bud32/predicted ATPase